MDADVNLYCCELIVALKVFVFLRQAWAAFTRHICVVSAFHETASRCPFETFPNLANWEFIQVQQFLSPLVKQLTSLFS